MAEGYLEGDALHSFTRHQRDFPFGHPNHIVSWLQLAALLQQKFANDHVLQYLSSADPDQLETSSGGTSALRGIQQASFELDRITNDQVIAL